MTTANVFSKGQFNQLLSMAFRNLNIKTFAVEQRFTKLL